MTDIKALADISTEYTTPAAGDLLFTERGGTAGKITFSNLFGAGSYTYSGTMTVTGTLNLSGGTLTVADGWLATAKIADDAVTLAKIADAALSGADATLITGTAGTAGNLAAWNADGDLVDGGSVYTLETEVATTSGTSADFTSIPAGVNQINIMLNRVSLSGTDELLVRIGDSGGLETSGYSSEAEYNGAQNTSTAGFKITSGGSAADNYSGVITLRRVSGNLWVSAGSLRKGGWSGGVKELTGELDRLSIVPNGSNTFDNGSISIGYQ